MRGQSALDSLLLRDELFPKASLAPAGTLSLCLGKHPT